SARARRGVHYRSDHWSVSASERPLSRECPKTGCSQSRITFKPIGLFAPEVSATTDNNGIYSVVIPPGRYRVSIGGCRRYVVQPTVAKDLDLTVVDGTNDERSMPSSYWLIDSGG